MQIGQAASSDAKAAILVSVWRATRYIPIQWLTDRCLGFACCVNDGVLTCQTYTALVEERLLPRSADGEGWVQHTRVQRLCDRMCDAMLEPEVGFKVRKVVTPRNGGRTRMTL